MEKITMYDPERESAESAERAFDAEERRYALERHDDGAPEREAERDEELEREDIASALTMVSVAHRWTLAIAAARMAAKEDR